MAVETTAPPLPEAVQDVLGNPVSPGDRIAYAVTYGRSAVMKTGRVLEFRWPRDPYDQKPQNLKMAVQEEAAAYGTRWTDRPALIFVRLKNFVLLQVKDEQLEAH